MDDDTLMGKMNPFGKLDLLLLVFSMLLKCLCYIVLEQYLWLLLEADMCFCFRELSLLDSYPTPVAAGL